MTYQVLARKYRPRQFGELVGQDHITQTLTESLKSGRIAHAYIFSGPRGIGKTTTARLLAMAVNCDNRDPDSGSVEPCNECESCQQISESRDVDVLEIDGASNNSVDQIRDLRENARYAPSGDRRKIYIIDEVHMLSRSAFNALLKILEEPPEHVIFIFATTEIEQVPDTVLSRCQRFDFRLIPTRDIAASLKSICENEDITVEDEALFLIAKFAEGSLRDAQSILDQMISFAEGGDETLTEDLVSETWGIAPYDQLLSFLEAFRDEDDGTVLELLDEHLKSGKDVMALISDLAEMIRNALMARENPETDFLSEGLPDDVVPRLTELAQAFRVTELTWMFDQLLDLHQSLRQHSRFQRELTEIQFVRLAEGRPRYNLSDIVDRLEDLEAAPVPADGRGATSGETTSPDPDPTETTDRGTDPADSPSTSDGESDADETVTPSSVDQDDGESVADEPPAAVPEDEDDTIPEDGPAVKNLSEEDWENLLGAIPNPARAYLRNSRRASLADGTLTVHFASEYKNHVEQLDRDKYRDQVSEACEEVLGSRPELKLQLIESKKNDQRIDGPEQEPSMSEEEQLLRQTRQLFGSE